MKILKVMFQLEKLERFGIALYVVFLCKVSVVINNDELFYTSSA